MTGSIWWSTLTRQAQLSGLICGVRPFSIPIISMIQNLRELYKYRELLLMIAWRDIRVKYKQSLMGFMWAIFMPMLIVCAGVLVKFGISTVSGKPMAMAQVAMVSVKAVPWAFLVGSIRFATNSLVGNVNLVTKINFPKEIFPIAAVLSNLFDFALAGCLLAVILGITRVGVNMNLIYAPILLVLLVMFTTALSIL